MNTKTHQSPNARDQELKMDPLPSPRQYFYQILAHEITKRVGPVELEFKWEPSFCLAKTGRGIQCSRRQRTNSIFCQIHQHRQPYNYWVHGVSLDQNKRHKRRVKPPKEWVIEELPVREYIITRCREVTLSDKRVIEILEDQQGIWYDPYTLDIIGYQGEIF